MTVASILGSARFASWLACFGEASIHPGEARMARSWGWPLACSQQAAEALSPTAHEEVNSTVA